jgi:hypothetical protein
MAGFFLLESRRMEDIATLLNRMHAFRSKGTLNSSQVTRVSKNNKRYIDQDDHPEIFQRLVPNKLWHNKYAKMMIDNGAEVKWFANWVLSNSKITDKCRYFAKSCGNKVWAATLKMIRKMMDIKEKFKDAKDWWVLWIARNASEYMLTECSRAREPAKMLSFLVKKRACVS